MPSSSVTKRKRSSNFSKEEEICLLEIIEKYKNIIENKTTNKVSQSEKENAWLKILNQFNSKNIQTKRTMEQIKSKYDNLKTKTRKEVAGKKKYIKQTGGGSPINYDLDMTTEAVLRIINLKTVVGLENNIDSDAHSMVNSDFNFKENIEPQACTEDIAHSSSNDTNLDFDLHDIGDQNTEPNVEDQPKSFRKYNDINLKSVFDLHGVGGKNTENDIEIQSRSDDGSHPKKIAKDSTNWSNYTPKKLKRLPNKKLRQMRTESDTVCEGKENYYKRKIELLQKTYEEESSIRRRKEDREKEEHEKKMKLLDMEIILKEKQLQQHDNMY